MFRTSIPHAQSTRAPINYSTPILLLGSCFALNMSIRLQELKFPVRMSNPWGLLYNPVSIARCLNTHLGVETLSDNSLVHSRDRWVSLDSQLSSNDLATLKKQLTPDLGAIPSQGRCFLIVTLGSSWIYTHKYTGRVVANCHRIVPSDFEKSLLSVDQIVTELRRMVANLISHNPDVEVITTVSPVRHWRDGAVSNSRSKAHLLTAIHQVIETFSNVSYFPSFEIMIDDLRDYRFYNEDMLHPNSTAIGYIWDSFTSQYLCPSTADLRLEIGKVNRALRHRIRDPLSSETMEFSKKQLLAINHIAKHGIDMSKEILYFQTLLDLKSQGP